MSSGYSVPIAKNPLGGNGSSREISDRLRAVFFFAVQRHSSPREPNGLQARFGRVSAGMVTRPGQQYRDHARSKARNIIPTPNSTEITPFKIKSHSLSISFRNLTAPVI